MSGTVNEEGLNILFQDAVPYRLAAQASGRTPS